MIENFNECPISEDILQAIKLLGYHKPTNVQKQVIPALFGGDDVIVKAQTGSGKTASYGIPLCEFVDWLENKPQALVIVPTRELAVQVKEDIFHIGRIKRVKSVAIYGRAPMKNQELELKQKNHIVVGTPGRIMDHLERGTFDASNIKYLVIDEADELLRMGFIDQIEKILDKLPKNRTTMCFSATLPDDIKTLVNEYMREPVFIKIEEENVTLDRIEQVKYMMEEDDKLSFLTDIVMHNNPDSCIIFCNTQEAVDKIARIMLKKEYSCNQIHGGMEQKDRLKVMNQFRKGGFRYLIATDVVSRGIDIDDISLVINYDVPREKENYVHRIGRTARYKNNGKAISLVTKKELNRIKLIEQYIGKEIPIKEKKEIDLTHDMIQDFREKNSRTEKKRDKGEELNKDILKLHINAGKKDKMRPVDIVGTLCSISGIVADDIGIIQIGDLFSYVEILHGKGDMVNKELKHTPIKGKMRKVRKATRE